MAFNNHEIAYQNVVSKYYRFAPADIDAAIQDFHKILEEGGYEITGNLFYSMLSDPRDEEIMEAEIFLPIIEGEYTPQEDEKVSFNSYFNIKPMVMTRVLDDFEQQAQVKYWEVIHYIKQNGLVQTTPVFVEFKTSNKGDHYIEMSAGVQG